MLRRGYKKYSTVSRDPLVCLTTFVNMSTATNTIFKDASISTPENETAHSPQQLAPSRSYNLSINAQIIYAQSAFLPTLVSSRIHTQLEFLAVGSWWVLRGGQVHKIPSIREDVFNDESLSMKDKRGLMKFLRYVLQEETTAPVPEDVDTEISLEAAMSTKFKIPESLQAPLLALALSPLAARSIPFEKALARIRRHMRSMGYFGPGFGAVIPKYGGNCEISQVACRAQAVGGGIYLLGHGLARVQSEAHGVEDDALVQSTLSDGTSIRSQYVAGSFDEISAHEETQGRQEPSSNTWKSISVIGNPLSSLFPATSENGPNPAVAIVLVDENSDPNNNPIYLQVHSEDTGECPAGQCKSFYSPCRSSFHDDPTTEYLSTLPEHSVPC
jgi:Rab proteins geranylgeranyltransferase component A